MHEEPTKTPNDACAFLLSKQTLQELNDNRKSEDTFQGIFKQDVCGKHVCGLRPSELSGESCVLYFQGFDGPSDSPSSRWKWLNTFAASALNQGR